MRLCDYIDAVFFAANGVPSADDYVSDDAGGIMRRARSLRQRQRLQDLP